MIRKVTLDDAQAICNIYNYYILNSVATFELEPVTSDEVIKRIKRVTLEYPWIAFFKENELVGYAYADKWKTRKAYKYSVESTVYLKNGYSGRGIGSRLYMFLLNELKKINIHAVIAGISLPNDASIALHEKLGFKKIGQFKEVGFKFDKWVDVGYWELIIN
jgi:phosphinothricin acetyltransferase